MSLPEHTYRLGLIVIALIVAMILAAYLYHSGQTEGAAYFAGLVSALLPSMLDAGRVYRVMRNGNGRSIPPNGRGE